ncbi:MBL fold metallo-hydrolase [Christiangramia salexigens]|uniref:MBL fold metallo-hydrolase n=1 Tax=Christiangramia salexigens TaxID=1913577 RepID=A0A1L3J1R7_9FLAO|nr:MBL fold metallo-hydrolase [Christiangramia salexigens]APG59060.1 MBL fold metallo-hydrolase [Christiangramia salexigens]
MRRIMTLLAFGILLTGCKNEQAEKNGKTTAETTKTTEASVEKTTKQDAKLSDLEIVPVSHATGVFKWGDKVFYTDPVGGAEVFEGKPEPDFILITDIHGDHMDAATLKTLKLDSTKIIVPKAVQEKLPKDLQSNLVVLANGETKSHLNFKITAIPMYNLPQSKDAMHVKGRGNGYVIEKNGQRLYISGDTEDIPEMRNLKNIDVALISMNLPYTMPVDRAAEGVLAFQPKKVIPYHYRGKDGFSDIEKFKTLVNEGNKNIEVQLLDWYPSNKE